MKISVVGIHVHGQGFQRGGGNLTKFPKYLEGVIAADRKWWPFFSYAVFSHCI